MKLYVSETIRENADGEKLITIEVHKCKPKKFKYLIFVKK